MNATCQTCEHVWTFTEQDIENMRETTGLEGEVEILACPNCMALYSTEVGHA